MSNSTSTHNTTPEWSECSLSYDVLAHYLRGELPESEHAEVSRQLESNPACRERLEEVRLFQDRLKGAVEREGVPASLHTAIRSSIQAEGSSGSRTTWVYAAAAVIVLALAGWLTLQFLSSPDEPITPPETKIAEVLPAPMAEVLKIGTIDHIKCAMTFYSGDVKAYSHEKMVESLGPEYEGLLPVVQPKIEGSNMVVAHQCVFEGRRFVHMILKRPGETISIAMTKKRDGADALPSDRTQAAMVENDIPIYRTFTDGYEVAGFESTGYLIFVVSSMVEEENMKIAASIAPGVTQFLNDVADV